jgi:hypothetical protein
MLLIKYFGIMGDHLTKLGEEQEKKEKENMKAAAAPAPPIMTKEEAEEHRKVQEILSNPKLREILEDPEMQRVLQECQQPGKLMQYYYHPVYGPKLNLLKEAGLVNIEN